MMFKALGPLVAASALVAAMAAGGAAWAENHGGNGRPECPGAPGAYLGANAPGLAEEAGQAGATGRGESFGRTVRDTVTSALEEPCGVGAVPQEVTRQGRGRGNNR